MTMLGKPAPEFTATAIVDGKVVRDFSLSSFRDQYVVLFFYPEDFTSVCGSELHAFQERLGDFAEREKQPSLVAARTRLPPTSSSSRHLQPMVAPKGSPIRSLPT